MQSDIIKKYSKKSIPVLKRMATYWFNQYIRLRDTDENGYGKCISSGRPLKYGTENCQAGHFFPAGHYPALAFNEDNVHMQSKSDNYFKSGNLIEYRENLEKKIGKEKLDNLYFKAENYRRNGFKWDRFHLVDVIETYKQKCEEIKKTKNF